MLCHHQSENYRQYFSSSYLQTGQRREMWPVCTQVILPAHCNPPSTRFPVCFLFILSCPVSSRHILPIPSHPIPSRPVPSRPVPSRPVPSRPVSFHPAPSRPVPSRPVPSRPILPGFIAIPSDHNLRGPSSPPSGGPVTLPSLVTVTLTKRHASHWSSVTTVTVSRCRCG